jgi:6-phosphogluconolactonase (cycloisomerase 2 family)
MKRFQPSGKVSLVLTLTAVVFLSILPAVAQINLVYVESNIAATSNQNSIYAFSNNGLGVLTPVSGSPFLTGGTGVKPAASASANVFTSDGQLTTNSSSAFLYGVNGHTNTIAAFFINSDGTLAPVTGSPYASNGQDPVSLSVSNAGPAGNLLIAANEANDPTQTGGTPNFTTFRLSGKGALTPVSGSTVSEPSKSLASQALVNPGQLFAFGILSGTGSSLTCWSIGAGGKLVQDSVVTPPSPSKKFQGIATNPIFRTVYVGLPDVNEIAVYSYDKAGKLTFDRTVTDPGMGISHLIVNNANTVLYSTETNSNTVTAWDINGHQLDPTVLQTVTLSPGGAPANLTLDPTQAFLYVLAPNLRNVGTAGNFLHVLNVASDGTLIETATPTKIPVANTEEVQGLVAVQK